MSISRRALAPCPVRLLVSVHHLVVRFLVVVLFLGSGAAHVALLGNHFPVRVLEEMTIKGENYPNCTGVARSVCGIVGFNWFVNS